MKGSNITITAGAFSKARRFTNAVPYLDLISEGIERLVTPREVSRFEVLVRDADSLNKPRVGVVLRKREVGRTPLEEVLAPVARLVQG